MQDNKMPKVLKEAKESNEFHPLNEVKIFIFLERLVKRDRSIKFREDMPIDLLSKKNLIDEASLIIKKLLLEGQHPEFNPCGEELWKIDRNNLDVGLKSFLEERAEFLLTNIDKNMDHIKMSFSLDIVFGNFDPFVESKELKIEKIEIQTPFYKKIIEG